MKKTTAALFILMVFFMVSCSHKIAFNSPTSPSDGGGYTNSGKLKSQSIDTYFSPLNMTISATTNYYYDSVGRIRTASGTVNGMSGAGSTIYSYNSDGKLISVVTPQGSTSDNTYYTYDASGRLATLKVITDSTTNTKMVQTFTYDANNRISRIDEVDNGTPASYRLLNRDANGYVTSEDVYPPAGGTKGASITYVRDITNRTITVSFTFVGSPYDPLTMVYSYDASGFLQSTEAIMPILSTDMDLVNTLQNGLFDPAGMKGYYFTDSDLYGMTWISTYLDGYMP
jgi:YD repeat-containing protein